ncbi:MAG: hypothetical protein E7572_04485 [Ruminococcaceae bacterium]|jgi:hypothetical protein|nr:hypothetical protein [Oscillospiraceae bacterium]
MKLKKFTAGVLACALVAGAAAGCTIGGDESWCAKTSSTTLPAGAYIYELYNAYSEAQSKTTEADMKKAKIDSKDAMTWVNERAKVLTNELFLLDDKMKSMKLSFTSEENTQIKQTADNAWAQQFSNILADKNVSETSFKTAYADYTYKLRKVFQGTYDKGGTKAVSESDLQSYFEKNYSDMDYTYVPLEKQTPSSSAASSAAASSSTSSASTAMTDAEKAALKKELDTYLAQVQSGKLTVKEASAAYAKAHGATDNYQNVTEDLSSTTASSSLPADMIKAVKEMKNGETRLLEVSSYYYVLVTKNDIIKKTTSYLKDSDNRFKLLYAQKGEEFLKDIEAEAKAYKGVTWNNDVLKKFTADLFYTVPSSSTASKTASAAASSAASSTASSKK